MRLRPLLALALLAATPAAPAERPLPRPLPPGEVCGDPSLRGSPLPAITGEHGCGVEAPVLLVSADGVALDPPATVSCAAAGALADWLAAVRPAFPAGLAAVTVVDAYSCRNRNRARDGKLSEHARGNAIDVAAFRRGDGTAVSVAAGWADAAEGALLRRLHAAACGPFATVIGPEANALHADHLHLDVASRRSGPYCE